MLAPYTWLERYTIMNSALLFEIFEAFLLANEIDFYSFVLELVVVLPIKGSIGLSIVSRLHVQRQTVPLQNLTCCYTTCPRPSSRSSDSRDGFRWCRYCQLDSFAAAVQPSPAPSPHSHSNGDGCATPPADADAGGRGSAGGRSCC